MKLLLLIFMILLISSCGQSFNSNSSDNNLVDYAGIDTSTPAGQRLNSAFNVINVRCISCHTGYHSTWSSYRTDAAWRTAGLVQNGNPMGSAVYSRLKNVGGDMPLQNPQISDSERGLIETWINQL